MNREEILKNYPVHPDNLLAILHDLQAANGQNYLAKEDLEAAGKYLNLSYGFVYGVATFYTMYSLKPRGKHIIRICQSPPCHLMGSTDLSKELMNLLGVKFGHTTTDGLFTLEMTSCLGVCGVAPAMMIDEEVYGNLTKEKLHEIIETIRREK
jgi:NADH:ubiquinone oxidoreductase subunit E